MFKKFLLLIAVIVTAMLPASPAFAEEAAIEEVEITEVVEAAEPVNCTGNTVSHSEYRSGAGTITVGQLVLPEGCEGPVVGVQATNNCGQVGKPKCLHENTITVGCASAHIERENQGDSYGFSMYPCDGNVFDVVVIKGSGDLGHPGIVEAGFSGSITLTISGTPVPPVVETIPEPVPEEGPVEEEVIVCDADGNAISVFAQDSPMYEETIDGECVQPVGDVSIPVCIAGEDMVIKAGEFNDHADIYDGPCVVLIPAVTLDADPAPEQSPAPRVEDVPEKLKELPVTGRQTKPLIGFGLGSVVVGCVMVNRARKARKENMAVSA